MEGFWAELALWERHLVRAAALWPVMGVFLLCCAAPTATAVQDERAEKEFGGLEERFLAEKSLRFKFNITSQGSISSSLQGQLRLRSGNRVEIDAKGDFQSKPVNLRFVSDGKRMRWSAAGQQYDVETPKTLNEAIIIGFTRMGLLDNLAMLLTGQQPSHAEGGIADWVQVSDFRFAAPERGGKQRGRALVFQIGIEGQPAGEVEYWLSPLAGMPVLRKQTIHARTGDITVVESYEFPD